LSYSIFLNGKIDSEIVGKRGWQGLRADFSKPQVDASVMDSMCFFSTHADFGQGWANIKYCLLGRRGTNRFCWQCAPCCRGQQCLVLLDMSLLPQMVSNLFLPVCWSPETSLTCILNLPYGNSSLGTWKGSEKAKGPTSSLLPALASTFPLSLQSGPASIQIWVPSSSLSPPPHTALPFPPPPHTHSITYLALAHTGFLNLGGTQKKPKRFSL
jgi:hypothetical protein